MFTRLIFLFVYLTFIKLCNIQCLKHRDFMKREIHILTLKECSAGFSSNVHSHLQQ